MTLTEKTLSSAAIRQASRPIPDVRLQLLRKAIMGEVGISDARPDITVDLREFEWVDKGQGRTWWWALQQLPNLAWSVGDLSALEPNLASEVCELNRSVVCSWMNQSKPDSISAPLTWHDHATALRAIHLFRWTNTLLVLGMDPHSLPMLEQLIVEHTSWLVDPANYSRGNNHGFEQAWVLLEIAADWPGHAVVTGHMALAMSRLQQEIIDSFTAEGVHKENSPGYQYFMIKRIRELKAFLENRGLSIPHTDMDGLIRSADQFLAAMALPDGSLPLIGDTQHKPRQKKYTKSLIESHVELLNKEWFDYTRSGYFIWRKRAANDLPEIHMVMKNMHESQYHRHDDDLMVHLVLDNAVVFGDAGLYAHDRTCPVRAHVRSAYAHSTLHPASSDTPCRNPESLRRKPNMIFIESTGVLLGKTYLYPSLVLSRRCKFIGKSGKLIKITDIVKNHASSPVRMVSGFLVPCGFQVSVQDAAANKEVVLEGEGLVVGLRIMEGSTCSFEMVKGWSSDGTKRAIISDVAGNSKTASKVNMVWEAAPQQQSKLEYVISAFRAD